MKINDVYLKVKHSYSRNIFFDFTQTIHKLEVCKYISLRECCEFVIATKKLHISNEINYYNKYRALFDSVGITETMYYFDMIQGTLRRLDLLGDTK